MSYDLKGYGKVHKLDIQEKYVPRLDQEQAGGLDCTETCYRVAVIIKAKGGLNLKCDVQHAHLGVMTRCPQNLRHL